MEWLLFALLTALFTSIAILIQKKALLKEHAMEFCASIALISLIIVLPLFLFIDYQGLQFIHFAILLPISVLNAIAFLLVSKSIRHMQISKALPLLALGPAVTTIIAFAILREKITLLQIGGIGLLIGGAYVLETRKRGNIFSPFKLLKKSRYLHYILAALLIYGLTTTFSRFLLSNLDMQPIAFIAFSYVLFSITFMIMLSIFHDGFKGIKHGIKRVGPWLFFYSLFLISAAYMQANALKIAQAGLVASIKITYVLFAVVIGGELFHDHNLLKRSLAALIIVAGAILLAI